MSKASADRDHPDEHPHDHGGCLCDHPIEPHEETPDHELPEATGGVEEVKRRSGRRPIKTGGV